MQGEASQDAPAAQSEKLWQHYQRPAKKVWPEDRVPMRRYEWSLEVLRLDLTLETRGVALTLALLGNADGSGMIPADPRFLASVDRSYRQAVGTHIAQLQSMGLLTLVKRAGGRSGVTAHVFHLSMPVDPGELPYRLDADWERLEEKPKGTPPIKAIEASMAKRLDRKVASGQFRPAPRDDRNGTSGETPRDDTVGRKQASDETAPGNEIEQKPASGETSSGEGFDRNSTSSQSPVDNPLGRNRASGETPLDDQAGQKPASDENGFHRKRSALSSEAQHTFAGSPASDSVVKPLEPTTPVVSIGGDLTDARDPTTDAHPEMSPSARFAAAQALIDSLTAEQRDAAVQAAVRELRAAGLSPTARGAVVRAAEIVARPEWDSA